MSRFAQLLLAAGLLLVGIGVVLLIHRPVTLADVIVSAVIGVVAWLLIAAVVVMRTQSSSATRARR